MIGVQHSNLTTQSGIKKLKRDILFFDKIILCNIEGDVRTLRESHSSISKNIANEIEYLLGTKYFSDENEFLILDNDFENKELTNKDEIESIVKSWLKEKEALRPLFEKQNKNAEELGKLLAFAESSRSRTIAGFIKGVYGKDATSLDPLTNTNNLYHQSSKKDGIIEIALNKVPIPNEFTPWESIMEMLQDEDLRNRARKLRIWARQVTEKNFSKNEIIDILEDQIFEYEQCLKLHTKKANMGILKSVIVGGGEFAENLVKLKFGKISKNLFSIQEKRTALLEAEAKAPGREVSIIPILQQKLSD